MEPGFSTPQQAASCPCCLLPRQQIELALALLVGLPLLPASHVELLPGPAPIVGGHLRHGPLYRLSP